MNWYRYMDDLLGKRDSKKVKNNTYAERLGDGTIGLRLHSTYVVTYYPDGSEVLNSGGWETVTTQDRINNFSSAWVGSGGNGSGWVVRSSEPIAVKPTRTSKCRTCKGNRFKVYPGYKRWDGLVIPDSQVGCYRCKGTGTATYGGQKVYPQFYSGVRVRDGQVIENERVG